MRNINKKKGLHSKYNTGNSTNRIRTKKENSKFHNDVNLKKSWLFFPEGFEKLFITFYGTTLPYILGLAFLFFYIAKNDTSIFFNACKSHSFILTWCIGYEILAVFLLIFIFKSIFFYTAQNIKLTEKKAFKRP